MDETGERVKSVYMEQLIIKLFWASLILCFTVLIYTIIRKALGGSKEVSLKIPIVVVLVFAGVLFIYYLPQPILSDPEHTQISYVKHNDEEISSYDEAEMIEILSAYKCRRTIKDFAPYENKDIEFEIDGGDSTKPIHILLGEKTKLFYISGNKVGYQIIDKDNDLRKKLREAID